MLLPRKSHWCAIDRKVDVANNGTFFHLCSTSTARTANVIHNEFDHQLDVLPAALVVQNPDVFQAYQSFQNLSSVSNDKGASIL